MTTDNKQYCLKWNHFSDNILTSLESLRGDEDFVDVTIACEGQSFKAHKVVLSACSQYIKKLLKENPCAHPIIILKDVALPELKALLSFMYNGQVMVEEAQIPKLLRTAELLEIRGLSDLTNISQQAVSKPRDAAAEEEWGELSDTDEEYDDDETGDEPDQNTPPDVSPEALPADFSTEHKQEEPALYSRVKEESMKPYAPPVHPADNVANLTEAQECPVPNRAMMPSTGQRAADFATRVSQMEDTMLPGDVLVIGETHITPARCVPRPVKPPFSVEQAPPAKQQCFGPEGQSDGRMSLEMSLRLQMQRKLESERLRAMERLRQAEAAAFNDPAPIDCSSFPLTNGVHPPENGNIGHREDHGLSAQQPPATAPPPAPPTITLPLSPDLQLKMLMCRDFKKYTNMLLVAVFGREVLATHCLNGSKGSAKPRLDTEKVTRVIATVMEKFDVPASTVREAIRVKLNNEDKLKKRSKRASHPLL